MVLFCEVEKNYSKYKDTFPAVYDMIKDFESNDNLNVAQFINKYRLAPYGLGEVSLILFVSFLIKFYGDELSYKKNPDDPGEVSIQSYDQINEIVNNTDNFAVFEKRKLDDIQKDFLLKLFKKFSKKSGAVGIVPKLKDVAECLRIWFNGLPKLAQSEGFYSHELNEELLNFLQFMKSHETLNT